MRKIILLLAIICATVHVHAQPISQAKSTAGGSLWFDYSFLIEALNGSMSYNLVPLWFDSSVRQNEKLDTIAVEYISAAQMVDPIYFDLWTDPNILNVGDIYITPTNPYTVDSISFAGVYAKNINRPNTVVDTLILSVSPNNYQSYDYTSATGNPEDAWVDTYVPQPGDTIKCYSIFDVDSVNRASNATGRILWKIPLDSTMRITDTVTLNDVVTYTFPVMVNGVPGSCNIPAGSGVAITVTFKSGDAVVNPGQDSIKDYHRFYLLSASTGSGQIMPYYNPLLDDRNMSNLMLSDNSARYWPSVELEGKNTAAFEHEFHTISAFIDCPDCPVYTISVNEVSQIFSAIKSYPNPAENEVIISFSTLQDEKVNLSIVSAVGQVILKKDLGVVKANNKTGTVVSTSNLANGIYFYTMEAGGQKSTGRFIVTH